MTTSINGTTGLQVDRVPGTTTNDNAAAGYVGEYLTASRTAGNALSLINVTYTDITSLSLTAGDWDVQGVVAFAVVTGPSTGIWAGVSTTSATIVIEQSSVCQPAGAGFTSSLSSPVVRFSLAATTTIYLVARAAFSGGTVTGYGQISARRVR